MFDRRKFVAFSAIAVVAGLLGVGGCASAGDDELIVCGAEEVFVLDIDEGAKPEFKKLWGWSARRANDMPEALKDKFDTTDDCKSVNGGKWILITSSGGGVALVERATEKLLFWANCPSAHSADLIGADRIAVAISTGENCNALELYDVSKPMDPVWRDELYSGHGVVWDSKRRLVWALGDEELRAYELVNWETQKPSMKKKQTFKLPSRGGHDLQAVPGGHDLVLTTGRNVWLFDRDKGTFREHPELAGRANVKSVMVHPRMGRTVYVQAEESWWAYHIRFLDPTGEIHMPSHRLYKSRWNVRVE